MLNIYKNFTKCSALLAVAFVLTSCGVIQVAVEKIEEGQQGDIRLVKNRNYDTAIISQYEKILVIVKDSNNSGFSFGLSSAGSSGSGGSSSALLAGRVVTILTEQGYDVFEIDEVERVATDDELERFSERTILRLSREKLNIDGMIVIVPEKGSASKVGFFGLGAGIENGIISLSAKLVDIKSGKNFAIISTDYPEPRTATEVLEGGFSAKVLRMLNR